MVVSEGWIRAARLPPSVYWCGAPPSQSLREKSKPARVIGGAWIEGKSDVELPIGGVGREGLIRAVRSPLRGAVATLPRRNRCAVSDSRLAAARGCAPPSLRSGVPIASRLVEPWRGLSPALTYIKKPGTRPGSFIYGGEGGIRTLDRLLTYTHFPGVLLQPLGHLTRREQPDTAGTSCSRGRLLYKSLSQMATASAGFWQLNCLWRVLAAALCDDLAGAL